jgi:hypothetical protein
MRRQLLVALLLGIPGAAWAFCGAYVGSVGANLTNRSSEVVLARDGDLTTLTLVMDYQGDADEFALLLPVPQVLGPDDVRSIEVELVDWVRDYSNPRSVSYTCDDLFPQPVVSSTGCLMLAGAGCSDASLMDQDPSSGWSDTANGVDVEANWKEYGYEFVVLDAQQSTGLFTWLTENGYAVPAGGDEILQEYIDSGSFFLAAKIDLSQVEAQGDWLPPIQFSYRSPVLGLPIRIGTISANGEQEVVMYVLTDPYTAGEVGISNYPELAVPNDCMWGAPGDTDLSGWYAGTLQSAVDEQGAGWVKEYSWDLISSWDTSGGGYHCDPCTPEVDPVAPTADGSFGPYGLASLDAHITRLRMRYKPEDAHADLVLYESRLQGVSQQLKYIRYDPDLEFAFPSCDEGFVSDPGTCPQAPASSGCGAPWPQGGLAALAVAALWRRRRP